MVKKFHTYIAESDLDHIEPAQNWQSPPVPANRSEIVKLCAEYKIKDYKIRADGFVDVFDNVELIDLDLYEIPIKFGKVKGTFNCRKNNLTTLENAPYEVNGNFDCTDSGLVTLEGGPKKVGRNFYCADNNLVSFEGAPEDIQGDFIATDNKILSLHGFPKFIKGYLQIERNPISRIISMFNGIPKAIIYYMINNNIFLDKGEIEEKDLIKTMVTFKGTSSYTEYVPYLRVLNKKERTSTSAAKSYNLDGLLPDDDREMNKVDSWVSSLNNKSEDLIYLFQPTKFSNYLSSDKAFANIWDGVNLSVPKNLRIDNYVNAEGVTGKNYFTSKSSEKTYVDFYPLDTTIPPVPAYVGSLLKKENKSSSKKKYYSISYNSSRYLIPNVQETWYIFDALGEPLLKDIETDDMYKPYIGEVGTIESEFNDPKSKTNFVLFKSIDGDHKFVIKRSAINPVSEDHLKRTKQL